MLPPPPVRTAPQSASRQVRESGVVGIAQHPNAPNPRGLFTSTFSGAGALGLFFSEFSTEQLFAVEQLAQEGLALADPRILPGVVLEAVQGIPLAGLSYAEGLSLIRAARRPIQLTFSRGATGQPQSLGLSETGGALAMLQRVGVSGSSLPTACEPALFLLGSAGASLGERPLNLAAGLDPGAEAVVFREKQPLPKRRYQSKERPADVWRVHGGTCV